MDEPARSSVEGAAQPAARWAAALPPAPWIDLNAGPGEWRFVPMSPRAAVLIVAAIVVGLLLWLAIDSVRPFVVGLLFVYLLDPPIRWLARHGVRRSIAILIVYVVGIVAFVEFMALTLTPLVNEILRFISDFPKLAEDLDAQLKRLSHFYASLQLPVPIRDWIDGMIAGIGRVGTPGGSSGGGLDLSFLVPLLTGAGSLIGVVFGYLILPVWVAYLLKDRVTMVAAFDRSLPTTWRFDTWAVIRTAERVFGQWVRGQLILGVAVAIVTFIGLLILSQLVDPIFGRYALLLSIIAGVLELVPIIGPIIAAIPAVLLAAIAGPAAVVAALLLYTIIQQVENNYFVPKIQGNAVELHPAAVMFAIIVGGSLAGLLGAILALPMAAAFRDVVRYLFRRSSPDEPEALAVSLKAIGMGPNDG